MMNYTDYRQRHYSMRIFTVFLFLMLAVSGIGFSIYLFYISNNIYMYFIAVIFLLLSLISGFFNFSASMLYYRSFFYNAYFKKIAKHAYKLNNNLPTVAIAIPIFNEDIKIVKRTVSNIVKIKYDTKKLKFYMLDDSTKPEKRKELKKLAEDYGFTYLYRKDRRGFKAGALNNFIKYSKEEYIAIFDYDEKLINKNFLLDLLPYFEDKNLSYLQTEKAYFRTGKLFPDSVALFDSFFFNFIEPARALDNTAIFAGSCGLIRRSALDSVGGFPEYVIEDTFFSFESDTHKFRSLYVPKVYALGEPIKTFTALAKQQWRYNYGDTQFLGYFFKRNKAIKSPVSNVDYLTHGFGLNYISLMLILFTIISIFIVFSAVPFESINFYRVLLEGGTVSVYVYLELFGIFALLLSFMGPVIMTKVYFGSIKKGAMVYLLNFALAIVRTKAAIAALLHRNPGISWNRNRDVVINKLAYSILNTKFELSFTALIFVFSLIAYLTKHVGGGVWLMAYGFLYLTTTIFIYKYK